MCPMGYLSAGGSSYMKSLVRMRPITKEQGAPLHGSAGKSVLTVLRYATVGAWPCRGRQCTEQKRNAHSMGVELGVVC